MNKVLDALQYERTLERIEDAISNWTRIKF